MDGILMNFKRKTSQLDWNFSQHKYWPAFDFLCTHNKIIGAWKTQLADFMVQSAYICSNSLKLHTHVDYKKIAFDAVVMCGDHVCVTLPTLPLPAKCCHSHLTNCERLSSVAICYRLRYRYRFRGIRNPLPGIGLLMVVAARANANTDIIATFQWLDAWHSTELLPCRFHRLLPITIYEQFEGACSIIYGHGHPSSIAFARMSRPFGVMCVLIYTYCIFYS